MASSSKTINMPLIFVISIGATVSLVAITMFGLAWYEYESRVVLREQVIDGPTHDDAYERRRAEQEANLGDIESAILSVAAEQVKGEPATGHGGHSE
ncbi:MAG: hypothetical protein AAGB26_14215 [Planctomycetota bacterium]